MIAARACVIGVVLGTAGCTVADSVTLPDPFVSRDGTRITGAEQWPARRAEIIELFRENVFGRAPVGRPAGMRFETIGGEEPAFGGLATRRQVRIVYGKTGEGDAAIRLTVYLPAGRESSGCFLLILNRKERIISRAESEPTEFWPVEDIVRRGFATAAFHYEDVAADDPKKAFDGGVFAALGQAAGGEARTGDSWGTIAAWAWGASRAIDWLKSDAKLSHVPLAVIGHSRGGKTALWCGAQDERVDLTISNDSGCTGAAISRFKTGETVRQINERFPHWFAVNYRKFNDDIGALPVDQHLLLAAIAPRLVYVASAADDAWSDPKAEFHSCVEAGPVFRLLGRQGLSGDDAFPAAGEARDGGDIGYHLRPGGHDLLREDWSRYMDFAARHWVSLRRGR